MKPMQLISGGALALIAMMGATSAQEYPELTLKQFSTLVDGNAVADVDNYFAKLVNDGSGGKIKVDIYWNRALAKDDELFPLMDAGAIQIATYNASSYSDIPTLAFMNSVPGIFRNGDEVMKVAQAMYARSENTKAELKAKRIRPLIVRYTPEYYLLCKTPVKTMEDLRGKKIRSVGAYIPVMLEAIGAIPVQVASTEMYQSLDKGVIDCAYWIVPFLLSAKMYEVAPYFIDFSFGTFEIAPTVVSETAWESWSPEVQALVEKSGAEATKWGKPHMDAGAEADLKKLLENAKLVEFTEKDKLRAAIPDMRGVWRKKQEEQGRGQYADEVLKIVGEELGR